MLEKEGVYEQHPAEALLMARKIWEICDQKPIFRTVIQTDGDIFTQVDLQYRESNLVYLHELHMKGVGASIQYWGTLAGVLSDFLASIVRVIFRRS